MNDQLDLAKFYAEQRDKHVQQIMAINGQGTFGTLAVAGAVLIGSLGLKKGDFTKADIDSMTPWFIVTAVGILSLFIAAAMYSIFHTGKIKRFETLIRNRTAFARLAKNEFQIMPNKSANYLIFFGLIILLIGVFGILLSALKSAS